MASASDTWGWPWRKNSGAQGHVLTMQEAKGFAQHGGTTLGFSPDPGPGSPKTVVSEAHSANSASSGHGLGLQLGNGFGSSSMPILGIGTGSMFSDIAAKDRDVSELLQKQSNFERQMHSADQRQSELFHFQWNLLREQMGSFARDMAQVTHDIDRAAANHERFEQALAKESDERETQARGLREEVLSVTALTNRLDSQVASDFQEIRVRLFTETTERQAVREQLEARFQDELRENRSACEALVLDSIAKHHNGVREQITGIQDQLDSCRRFATSMSDQAERRHQAQEDSRGEHSNNHAKLLADLQEHRLVLNHRIDDELRRAVNLEAKIRQELSEVSDAHDAGLKTLRSDLSHDRFMASVNEVRVQLQQELERLAADLESCRTEFEKQLQAEADRREMLLQEQQANAMPSSMELQTHMTRLREELEATSNDHHLQRKSLEAELLDLLSESKGAHEQQLRKLEAELQRSRDEQQQALLDTVATSEARLTREILHLGNLQQRQAQDLTQEILLKGLVGADAQPQVADCDVPVEAAKVSLLSDNCMSACEELVRQTRVELEQRLQALEAGSAEAGAQLGAAECRAEVEAHKAEVTEIIAALRFTQDQRFEVMDATLRQVQAPSQNIQSLEARLQTRLHEDQTTLRQLAVRHGDLERKIEVSHNDLERQVAARHDDLERKMQDDLAKMHIYQETARGELEGLIQRNVPREEFEKEKVAVWTAMENHTHGLATSHFGEPFSSYSRAPMKSSLQVPGSMRTMSPATSSTAAFHVSSVETGQFLVPGLRSPPSGLGPGSHGVPSLAQAERARSPPAAVRAGSPLGLGASLLPRSRGSSVTAAAPTSPVAILAPSLPLTLGIGSRSGSAVVAAYKEPTLVHRLR